MRDAAERPALQLFQQVFKEQGAAGLEGYLKAGGSVFALVEKGARALTVEYGMSDESARAFMRRANSLVTYVRRRYIEGRLTGEGQAAAGASSGLLSMVTGPTYERLFNTPFDALCPADALESLASPVAYLIELLRWIRDRIEPHGVDTYPLHERRADLKRLSVDFNAVHRSVSSVDIIVAVLETFIAEHGSGQPIEQALIESRYPNGLPFYQHWASLDAVARRNGLLVGDFAHTVDLSFPYFLSPQAWSTDAGRALAHASRLGPYQRRLLMEPAVKFEDREDFYARNFGADGLSWQNLNQLLFFGERTKLDTPGVEALLSTRGFAPVRSANVTYADAAPAADESERSGSVYLNANTAPAVSLTRAANGSSFLHRLSANPTDAAGLARYDRMNRKVRLDAWLGLPCDQVDALLVAAINAQVRGGGKDDPWWISENVVHALGLFQSLRERYGCTAPDFAAFIDAMGIYGRGEAASHFDQVFNRQSDYRRPLQLDGLPFAVLPVEGGTDLTVSQLCNGLGIDPLTYGYLAVAIAQARGAGDTLARSPAVVSAFYRLVRLPRLLGITPVEGLLMLNALGGEEWVNGLAGDPWISTGGEAPSVLNLIHALHACVQWCRDRDLPVLWMLQQAAAPQPSSAVSDAQRQLFDKVVSLLPAALFSNNGLLMAGVPPLPAADWLGLLGALADGDGLVLPFPGTEEEYLTKAREALDHAVTDGLGEIGADARAVIVEQMLGVLLQARQAQVALVQHAVAVYATLEEAQVLPVLEWADVSVHGFLRQVRDRIAVMEDPVRGLNESPDPLLALLADIQRRSEVVAKLGLSVALLRDYLAYGHKAWLNQDDRHVLSVRTLYYLTLLSRAFAMGEQPEQKLLDYLWQVNHLPDVTGDALWLAQQAASIRLAEFFGWSLQDVRECVSRIDPSGLKVLKNLVQLDVLMRVRALSADSGMDALTIFMIGRLPEELDTQAYADAAEHALLSLTESRAPAGRVAGGVKELVQMSCVADKTEAVANKPGERIRFTVTLKRADGRPLSGVMVHWRAALGSVAAQATGTDGTVKADYLPGKVTGTDTPAYWLDLFDEQLAPTVQVTFETASLQFPAPLKSPVPLDTVEPGGEAQLYAVLMDAYGNPGANSLVQWFAEPQEEGGQAVIRPRQTFTDPQGLVRVFVASPTGGTFTFSVLSEASEKRTYFDPIMFAAPTGSA
ncbi:Tc toxin subunit A [Pseudomonas sp. R16(2017)]|uniref:Tc toxin subunit A n=1 Tax=Pseudomonas sp. R16(2017) TaxID=1981704 RepID=UPI000A1DC59A|nr:Tc toxin subunit A [Pseudomonas sp. R16(2017)]